MLIKGFVNIIPHHQEHHQHQNSQTVNFFMTIHIPFKAASKTEINIKNLLKKMMMKRSLHEVF
jgi:hypothetical protein